MKVGGLQKISLIDFPERVAAVLFTQGCNMRCPYCHNPELVLPEKFLSAIPSAEVLSFLQSRVGRLEGVVITGGEPTLHNDLCEFIGKIKEMSFAIKLDTNGTRPEMIQHLFQARLVDYIAMDIKAPLAKYEQLAGCPVDVESITESIRIIKASGIDYEFRTTLVKSMLNEKDVAAIADLIGDVKRLVFKRGTFDDKNLDPTMQQKECAGYSQEVIDTFQNRYGKG